MLNISGGSKVSDLKILEADTVFCEILLKAELYGLRRKVRRVLERRWRKEKKRTIPSPSAAFRYLASFHDSDQKKERGKSNVKAFIPTPNTHLNGLMKVNRDVLSSLQAQNPQIVVTLDMDATLVETNKKESLQHLPAGVEKVRLRSETAGYQHDLMKFCDTCEDKRYGKIEFAIGANVHLILRKQLLKLLSLNGNLFIKQ